MVFWFARQNKFKGLKKANQLISRDEGLHGVFACHMHKKLGSKQYDHLRDQIGHPLTQDECYKIINSFVEIESKYIKSILPEGLRGMNADLMTQYIKYMANFLASNLGFQPLYSGVSNPFDFMEKISTGIRSTDFFKKEVTEYQKAGVGLTNEEQELSFGEF